MIGEDGEQLGIVSSEEANRIAAEKGLDLVKISPNAKPPVCKIMDYGKYRFEQAKRAKEAKKNQRVMKNAVKFLGDGDRVKVTIRFRGREMAHTDIGKDILRKFAEGCSEVGNMDKDPKLEGRNMSMFISPKSQAQIKKAAKEKKKQQEEAERAAQAEAAGNAEAAEAPAAEEASSEE